MKKEKENIDSSEKMFWIMGIAWIVFLVLVLVSILALYYVREKADSIEEKLLAEKSYETLEDGTKINASNRIATTQVTIDQVEFSHFSIQEKDVNSSISFEVTSHDAEMNARRSFVIILYDAEGNELTRFALKLEKLPLEEPVLFRQNIEIPCVTADRIEVQQVNMEIE